MKTAATITQQHPVLTTVFKLVAPLILSGCASYSMNVDNDTCNTNDTSSLKIPLVMEFGVSTKAISNNNCKSGKSIGYAALLGRQKDGTLHPASLITWHRQYQNLTDKINAVTPEEAKPLENIRFFADHFIKEGSVRYGQSMVTSQMASAMFEKKILDPQLFSLDGTYTPPVKEKLCEGKGMFLTCKPPKAAEAASAPVPE